MPKGRSKTTSASEATPWWLSGGEEECPHCGIQYAYEIEVRCTTCDSPCCPHCKARDREGRNVCPECVGVGEASTHREDHARG